MVESAAYALNNSMPIPPALTDYWKNERWGLPYSGGRDEQPIRRLNSMTMASRGYNLMNNFKNSSGGYGEFLNTHPGDAELIGYLLKEANALIRND